jgi:DNA polymerase-4
MLPGAVLARFGNAEAEPQKGQMQRYILHCDCNAFYASVEETFDPSLKNVPMAIAGDAAERHGIILAKNEKAKKFGVRTAETIWSAQQKCPGLVLLPPRYHTYEAFCERNNAVYGEYTDLVERFGLDESFLDVSLYVRSGAPPAEREVYALSVAHEIRERIKREMGITISVGLSWNKVFAKLGSDYKKPDAVTAFFPDTWQALVFPLPAADLLLVGRKTAEKLERHYIRTIGELADTPRERLVKWFGKVGNQLYIFANGLDNSPVLPADYSEAPKSVGNSFTFPRDLITDADIRNGVALLAGETAARLRDTGYLCRTVKVLIRYADLRFLQRQATLRRPTFSALAIEETALRLIAMHRTEGMPIRTLGVTGERLLQAGDADLGQLSLFDNNAGFYPVPKPQTHTVPMP